MLLSPPGYRRAKQSRQHLRTQQHQWKRTTPDAAQSDRQCGPPQAFERAGAEPVPCPVSDAGQECQCVSEHEVELLLYRKEKRGVTRYLV